ncbi:MAG: flagellar hook-basal body complex protein FliE [Bacillota bacterium]|nr:flagellar hook-basal body complex protein FliE [Bacillota bacterium]
MDNISGNTATTSDQNGAASFLDTLKSKLDAVNDKQLQADADTEKLIKGENVDIHQVMLSTEEAKLSLQMAVQVRNKLLDAYQELNRMQL